MTEIIEELKSLQSQLDPSSVNFELEDKMFDIAFKYFLQKIDASSDGYTIREHGWYYNDFELNNNIETFCFHTRDLFTDATLNRKYIGKDMGYYYEDFINKYQKLLDK